MNGQRKNLVLAFVSLVVVAFLSGSLTLRAGEEVKDPVCGMKVDSSKALYKSEYEGKTYYFCSEGCKKKFDANPLQFVKKEEKAPHAGMAMMHQEKHEHGKEGETCCEMMKDVMKDVKFEVTNLPNGIQVKITSDKPEVVKKIQEMHKEGKGMGCCMMKKD